MLHAERVGKLVETSLIDAALIDDEGVAQIAALDESHVQEGFYFADENKGASTGNLLGEVGKVLEHCALRLDELAVGENNGGVERKMIAGLHTQARTRDLIVVLKRFDHFEITTFGLLFAQADSLYFAHIEHRTTVEDGKFRPVDLDEAVVDAHGHQGGHGVFDGGNATIGCPHHGAARSVDHVFGQGHNFGLSFEIYATNAVAVIFVGGMKSDSEVETGVQSLTGERERGLKGMLHR